MKLLGATWVAIDFLTELGRLNRRGTIIEVSKTLGISSKYAEQVLAELRRAGIVRSFRGCNGGYALTRPAKDITVTDIIRAMKGDVFTTQEDSTPKAEAYNRIADGVKRVTDKLTLQTLIVRT